jgi:hypothetical protein
MFSHPSLGSRSHAFRAVRLRSDGWMDAFITHACRWMDAVLNFMLAEPRAIAPLCVITRCILRRADVSVTGAESAA